MRSRRPECLSLQGRPWRCAPITQKPGLIDQTLVVGEILFATSRERCAYLGTETRYHQKWLADRPHSWRYVHDVLGEADLLEKTKTEVGTAECGSNVRKDGNDEDDVALVDSLVVDRSPPCELTSLPTPVKTNVPNGSTKAEPLAHPQAAMSEAKGPQIKPGRGGDRQLKKQKLPAEISRSGRKLSHERMRIVLDSLTEFPILSYAATKAGIHRKTLEYWIKCSAAGHDGYDIKWQGVRRRFHILCEFAIAEAHDRVILGWAVWCTSTTSFSCLSVMKVLTPTRGMSTELLL